MEIKLQHIILVNAGALFGLVSAVALTSLAEDTELDSDPRVVPYNGVLEYNGQPLNGQADLQFTLTDVPGGEGANCIFTEDHDNVTAYSGRFSVNIGRVAGDLPDCIFNSEAMYIEIGVRDATANDDQDDTNDAYVTLAGNQRIHPVPFSYWAAEGSDLKVDGDLVATGDAAVGSIGGLGSADLYVAPTSVDRPVLWAGQFSVDTEDGAGLINLTAGAHIADGDNYAYNSTRGASRILMDDGGLGFLVGGANGQAGSTVGWSQTLYMNSSLATFGTSLTASGNIQANGDIQANGNIRSIGNLELNGSLFDTDGDVRIADNLDISGDIQDYNSSAVTISDGLNVTHNVTIGSDGSGNLTTNGTLTVTGSISDSNSSVYIDDDVGIEGSLRVQNDILLNGLPGYIPVVMNDSNEDGNNVCNNLSGHLTGTWGCSRIITPDGDSASCDTEGSFRTALCRRTAW